MSKSRRFGAKIAFFEFLPVINGCGRNWQKAWSNQFETNIKQNPFPTVYIRVEWFQDQNPEASGRKTHFSNIYLLKITEKQGVAMCHCIGFEFRSEIFCGGY